MAVALRKRNVALRHMPLYGGPVGEAERLLSLWDQPDALPNVNWKQRVRRTAVDQKTCGLLKLIWPWQGSVDIGYTHALHSDLLLIYG